MILQSSGRQYIHNEHDLSHGPIIWWIQRDQRLIDNWTYFAAANEAARLGQPIVAVFCLSKNFLGAQPRFFDFMLLGLKELFSELAERVIPLIMLNSTGNIDSEPDDLLAKLAIELRAGAVYTDFNPLRQVMSWKQKLAHKLHCPLVEIDTHNIIPCRIASEKQEYAARTFRPRVERQLDQWLHEFPREAAPSASQSIFFSRVCMQSVDGTNQSDSDISIDTKINSLYLSTRSFFEKIVSGSSLVDLPLSGCTAAGKRLYDFITDGLQNYTKRNDPNEPVVSGLSPYLHFGQISAQRVALEVRRAADNQPEIRTAAAEFIEELIVRRELSDNFCFYNKNYDSFEGFPAWAQKTLKEHTNDMRPYLYSQNQLENGETHDELWNAAQLNMIRTGSMPGYLRMYWAKKILEWTVSPEEALSITIRLNDRYMLDGRDPNGYTGAAWSIGGVHDRPWVDRPIFGKIRLMTLSGCRRKFDVDAWISNNS